MELGDDQQIMIEQEVKVKLYLEDNKNMLYTEAFDGVESNKNILILGMRVPSENDVILNIRDQIVTIRHQEYELDPQKGTCDTDLFAKTKIWTLKETQQEL